MNDTGLVTACTMDCPDACSLIAAQGAGGRLDIRGNPDHPVTQGFTCAKVKRHLKRLSSPNRIIYPMRRTASGWERIDWDTALDLCADKIRSCRSEPSSILYFHGEGAKGVLKQIGHLFFVLLGATRVRGSFCDSAGYSACMKDFGSREISDVESLLDAHSIVNWGKDLSRSSVHMASLVQKARQRGASVLTISPGGDLNRSYSDFNIRIRPGTDRFLACAAVRLFIERGAISEEILSHTGNWGEFKRIVTVRSLDELLLASGIGREEAERIYDFYTRLRPTATIIGAGLQRYGFGGENVRFINALAMISGNIGIRGGGSYFHMNSLRNLNLTWTRAHEREGTRFLGMPVIGREIAEANSPPIRMAWVDGSNMINQAPGSRQTAEAFEKIEFRVVVDAFMTDTASRADLVLPATLMLEQEDIVASFMHDYVQYVRPVLDPPGEARSDFRILTELGARLDPPVVLPDAETCMRESLASPYLGITLEELKDKGFTRAKRPYVAYEGLNFDHADHKYHFPAELHDEPSPPSSYPLRLLSLVRRDAIHSQMLPEEQDMPPKVWVSHNCPLLADIDMGQDVFLASPLGRLKVRLETLDDLHRDVAVYRRGDWMKLGGGINQLIEPHITDMGTGTAFYDQYVRLENDGE
jgi:anaerobic selenocysteine-containing dehydrogenase